MQILKNPSSKKEFFVFLLITTAIVTLLNGAIFYFDIGKAHSIPHKPAPLLPPSWVIGSVWLFLINAMALSYWLLSEKKAKKSLLDAIFSLFLVCILYPIYTFGLSKGYAAIIGSITTIILSSMISIKAYKLSKIAALLICLTAIWTTFALFASYWGI